MNNKRTSAYFGRTSPVVVALFSVLTLGACSGVSEPTLREPEERSLRLSNCNGVARSLDPLIAAGLRRSQWFPDDYMASLAQSVPGGFAGVMYGEGMIPILMLVDPSQAAQAKAALAGKVPDFDVQRALVRQVRWDYEQLTQWRYFLTQRTLVDRGLGVNGIDTDEGRNRIRFDVVDEAALQRVAAELKKHDLPCDLVDVRIRSGGWFL